MHYLLKVSYLGSLFKRIATILLLTFWLFNWVGYRIFIYWYENREEARWEARLDNEQYDRGQLTLFKMSAAAIPYSNVSAAFERADGVLEVGNIHYRYVLKRLYNDSVEFLCLRDGESGKLQKAKSEIIHLAVDLPEANGRGKSSPAGKISLPLLIVFGQQDPDWCIGDFSTGKEKRCRDRVPPICQGHTRMGWLPPRASAA